MVVSHNGPKTPMDAPETKAVDATTANGAPPPSATMGSAKPNSPSSATSSGRRGRTRSITRLASTEPETLQGEHRSHPAAPPRDCLATTAPRTKNGANTKKP